MRKRNSERGHGKGFPLIELVSFWLLFFPLKKLGQGHFAFPIHQEDSALDATISSHSGFDPLVFDLFGNTHCFAFHRHWPGRCHHEFSDRSPCACATVAAGACLPCGQKRLLLTPSIVVGVVIGCAACWLLPVCWQRKFPAADLFPRSATRHCFRQKTPATPAFQAPAFRVALKGN